MRYTCRQITILIDEFASYASLFHKNIELYWKKYNGKFMDILIRHLELNLDLVNKISDDKESKIKYINW